MSEQDASTSTRYRQPAGPFAAAATALARRPARLRTLSVAMCLAAFAATPALAQVRNNPGYDRPGIGFSPSVLQAGDATLELGLPDWSRDDGVSLYSADALLRFGIGRSLELQLDTGWNRLDGPGPARHGRSNTALAVKFAPPSDTRLGWGVLGGVELTDGAGIFRNPERQYTLGASLEWEHDEDRASGLYLEAVDGETDSRLLAINTSWSLAPSVGLFVELAAQHLSGIGNGSMGGVGMTWQATPRVQLDIGVRHRLGGHADEWQGGFGVSVYFGK